MKVSIFKCMVFFAALFAAVFFNISYSYASPNTVIDGYGSPGGDFDDILEKSGIDDLDKLYEQNNEYQKGFSIKDTINKIISGEFKLSFSVMAKIAFSGIWEQISLQGGLIKRLVAIAVLSALLKNINMTFSGKAVGELSFFVCYMVLMSIVIYSFGQCAEIVRSNIDDMSQTMKAMLPVATALIAASGNVTQAGIMSPVILAFSNIISSAISSIIIPFITIAAAISMINCLSERSILGRFSELLKLFIGWGIKGSAFVFLGVLSLQRLGTPAISKLVGKAAKTAVGAVPIVGELMTGAVETAASITGSLRNASAAAIIIFIFLGCLLAIFKLISMIIIYKFLAAVLEPVCESRLIKCLESAAEFTMIILSSLFTVEVMYIFSALILLYSALG